MMMLDMTAASAGVPAIAVVRGREGEARLIAAPELGALSSVERIQFLVDGASALINAAEGLESRLRPEPTEAAPSP
jgi:hypothetical protein